MPLTELAQKFAVATVHSESANHHAKVRLNKYPVTDVSHVRPSSFSDLRDGGSHRVQVRKSRPKVALPRSGGLACTLRMSKKITEEFA